MRSDLFVKLKYQSITIILSVGNKYSVSDRLCDVMNKRITRKIAICAAYGKVMSASMNGVVIWSS